MWGKCHRNGEVAYLVYLHKDKKLVLGQVDGVWAAHGVCNVLDHDISRQDSVVANSRANGELHSQNKVSSHLHGDLQSGRPFPCRIAMLRSRSTETTSNVGRLRHRRYSLSNRDQGYELLALPLPAAPQLS